MVQLVEHATRKLVGLIRISAESSHTEDFKNGNWGLSSVVLGVNESRAVLPLTRHQCSIHCESSRVARAQASGDGRRRPLVTI